MHKYTLKILIVALGLVALCALFPPRRYDPPYFGLASRGFLFSPNIGSEASGRGSSLPADINGSQLMAECILILSVAGVIALAINLKRDET
jgi:hypothetical protein